MIQELQKTFHSIIKSLEILYVIKGIKPCARVMVHEDEISNVKRFLNDRYLYFTFSDFKALKQAQAELYSDKSIKIGVHDIKKGYFFAYMSKSKQIADDAKTAESKNDHKALGKILGYPDCCCEFFEKNFSGKNYDLTLKALENSEGFEFPFYSNIAARHFDVSLLSHFPHDFGCKLSVEIAKRNFEALKKHSLQTSEIFSSILQSCVVYTKDEGIHLLRQCQKADGELTYSDALTTTKSKMYYLLSSNKKLRIIGKNSFEVNEIAVSGKDYGIMLFT